MGEWSDRRRGSAQGGEGMKRVPETFAYCSANVAFIRLKDVISADRSAVPCGRWVPHVPGVFYPGNIGGLPFKVKPRWRMEWRR